MRIPLPFPLRGMSPLLPCLPLLLSLLSQARETSELLLAHSSQAEWGLCSAGITTAVVAMGRNSPSLSWVFPLPTAAPSGSVRVGEPITPITADTAIPIQPSPYIAWLEQVEVAWKLPQSWDRGKGDSCRQGRVEGDGRRCGAEGKEGFLPALGTSKKSPLRLWHGLLAPVWEGKRGWQLGCSHPSSAGSCSHSPFAKFWICFCVNLSLCKYFSELMS